jgi:hypothetical protein
MKLERLALAAVALPAVLAVLAFSSEARADSGDSAAADTLFRKGREAAEKGDWATACPKFAESQRLDPAPGTILNLADCEEHIGKLASAYDHFKTAVETMAPADDRVPFAKQHMAAVEKKVPHLTLNAGGDFPARARVMRDDVQLGSASFGLALPVDPGTHAVVVSAPGHVDRRVVVTLKAGDAQTITLKVGEVDASAPRSAAVVQVSASTPNATSPGTTSPARGAHDPKRAIGVAVGVVGVAGLAVGAVAGALVLGKKSIVSDPAHCDQTTYACDQAGVDAASDGKTLSTVSTVGFIAGGALVVAGVVLFLTGRPSSKSSATRALVVPEAYAGGGGGLQVVGAF